MTKVDDIEMKDVKEELNKKEGEDKDALEAVLMHIGQLGRYQKLMFLGMAPFGVYFAFIYFVQMFITATPQRHWCRVPELDTLDVELRRNLTAPRIGDDWERCVMYNANWTEVLLNKSVHPDTPTVPCKYGWEFEFKDIPYPTIVSEREWVCDLAGYIPLAQSIYFVGSFVGGIFFGWMADHFGRVPALVGTNMMAFVGGIATIYTTGIWDFSFCRFLVGMAFDNSFMIMYILIVEYVGPKYRTRVANLSFALYFGSGCLMLPWLALWISDWRMLLWVTTLPILMILAVPFTIPESARWLSSRGRVNDAVKQLRRFERINKKKVPDDVMNNFIMSANQSKQTNESFKHVLKSGPLRKVLVFMVIVYMVCAVIFDGLVRMSEGLGFDFFITFTLTSATEIPSVALLAFTLDKWGRRMLTCVPIVISGIFILIATIVPIGIPQVILASLARFMINMSFSATVQWSAELLPTPVRASGISLIHVSGYVATLLSPFIVYSERIWKPLPLIVFGMAAMLASVVGLMIPETNGMQMPQTIVESEKIISSYTLCGKAEADDNPEDNEKRISLIVKSP